MNVLGISGGALLCGVPVRTPGEMLPAPVAAADTSGAAPPGVFAFGPDHRFTWLLCAAVLLITTPCPYALIPPPRAAVTHDGDGHPWAPSPFTTASFSRSISEERS
ncbi:hypothetical protein [Streptomyces enissocaesilis]|uniref:Uncharacterized protein n=1 Tax=Streptomyces enissocaesilis TaxID=332589 RepID=A0ABP6JJ12_9ACTN